MKKRTKILIGLLVMALFTWVPGYFALHTNNPNPPAWPGIPWLITGVVGFIVGAGIACSASDS